MEKITLEQIEERLSHGELWGAMRNGRFWRLRRNGKTQRWKTRPADFRIPVKAGLRACGEVTQRSAVALCPDDSNWRQADFVCCHTDPNSIAPSVAP